MFLSVVIVMRQTFHIVILGLALAGWSSAIGFTILPAA
jgi:hypothetical protein